MSKNIGVVRRRQNDGRVTLGNNSWNEEKEKEKIHLPVPTFHYLGLLGLMLLVFLAVIVIEKQLPPGIKIADEHKHVNRFIAERAYNHLKKLTKLGPRIAGSYTNEVLAVNLLREEIQNIIDNAKDNKVIELDIQKASGAFNLEFLDGMTNVYQDVQNVVVKVGSRINSPHSLLINCHFDSVIDSPGGSDDGAGCAVMLEMLRVISQSDRILRHNIIFLFNGGEENFMPASHGFITQHKWAKEVRAFINLEACGAGGREVLFQAGPNHPWILETYSEEVPYPYASSLAQEIFQSGVIPGDTDYRIFRDFGNVSGLDFAWSANGYVYHTKFDTIDQIPLGSLQRTGDNILALAKGMAEGHQLSNIESHREGNLVFFDFLGAFVVRWPEVIADLINFLAVIFSIFTIYLNMKEAQASGVLTSNQYLERVIINCPAVIGTWILCVLACIVIAIALTAFGRTMSWYARPLWVFFLYIIPTLIVSMSSLLFHSSNWHKQFDLTPWTLFQIYYDAHQLVWTIFLCCGMSLHIRSSFIVLLWVAFPALGNLLKTLLFAKWRDTNWWLIMHTLLIGLPFVQCFYLILGALYLFIPIMGRAGAGTNSEIVMAIMVSLLYAMLISFVTPVILLVREVERIFSLLIGLFLISMALLLLTPLGFPYSGDPQSLAPQRFMIAHTKRIFHDSTGAVVNTSSGYWLVDLDINSPHSVDRNVADMENALPVDADCKNYLYCGLPYLVPVLTMIWKTHWLPGPEPNLPIPATLKILSREKMHDIERVTIEVAGPTHLGVMVSPVQGVELTHWSLNGTKPLPGSKWNRRQTYFVYYAYGLNPVPLRFSMDFKISPSHSKGPIMDIAITSHYLFGPGKSSEQFKKLVAQFPTWTAVTYWTASYESWIL